MKRILSALALALVVLSSARADAQGLFAATGSNGTNGQLYTINPATGAATLVGPIQINAVTVGVCPAPPCPIGLTGLAFEPATGDLYGVSGDTPPAQILRSIFQLDPKTGAATFVGTMTDPVGDIAFDSLRILYGWTTNAAAAAPKQLVDINFHTGKQTPVVGAVPQFPGLSTSGNGITILPSTLPTAPTIYIAPNPGGNETLYSVNLATSAATPLHVLTGAPISPALMSALAANAADNVYGVNSSGGNPSLARLVTIDPATGVVTDIGALPDNTDALAFMAGPYPDLTITKTHSGNFFPSQTGATYTLTVINVGNAAITLGSTTTVTDALPAGLTATAISGTGWTCTQPAGPCSRADALGIALSYAPLTLTVNVAADAPTGVNAVTNTATVSNALDINGANNVVNDPATVTPTPDLSVTKNHVGSFSQGQTGATYTITVNNVGGAPTTGTLVTVTDALPTGLTATGIAGAGWTCTQPSGPCTRTDVLPATQSYPGLTLTVNVAPNAAASVTNSATVAGGGEVNTGNDTASDPTTIVPPPDLAIAKTHTGNFFQSQTGATYTITVTNAGAGPKAAGDLVTVTDAVPAGLTATAISGTGWTCTQPSGPCTRTDVLASLGAYSALTLTVDVANDAAASVTNSATVSTPGDQNAANNTASDPTTVASGPNPGITKTHTGSFFQGQAGATYTLTVTNSGATPTAGTVTVTEALPAFLTATSISGTGWTCTQPSGPCSRADALGAGLSYEALTLTVNVANNAPASVTNSATVSGGGDVVPGNNTASDPTTIAGGPNPGITKTHTGNFSQAQVGAAYAITVTNSGATPTFGTVTVSEALPPFLTATSISGTGWTCTQPSGPCSRADALGTGLSYEVLTLTVNVAGNAPANVTNSATVSGGGDVNLADNTASDPTSVLSSADLTITKTHTGNFRQGQTGAKYLITVTNVGVGATRGQLITVADTLPAGLTATSISSTSAGWTCTQPSGPCTNSNILSPGSSFLPLTLTVDVAANAPTSITNTAAVSGGGDINPANNTASDPTTIARASDLTITKTHAGNFRQGQTGAKYLITVTNAGTGTSSGLITVTDALPAGLTATSISSTSAGWTCTQPSGPCTNPNLLAPGSSFLPLTLTVSVAGNAPASVTNTATVSGGSDINPANNTANDVTTVTPASDLTITKTHTGNFRQGQTGAKYFITVTNAGTGTSSGLITVTDAVPTGLIATSISSTSAGWTCTQPSGPCTNPNLLGPGLSFLPITLTVDVAVNAPASVTNSATVSGGGDANAANNTATDLTTITPAADLTITKTHAGNFRQGQTGAKYFITVTNAGTGRTSGLITVTDALPAGLTATSISSASAGWTCTQPSGPCTNPNLLGPGLSFLPLTLTVDVAVSAPASVTNTATVSGGGDANAANNTASDPTTITPGSDLTITKTHAGSFRQGQTGAKYTITVTNAGSGTTNGLVTVTDAVPTGLIATSISSASAGWTCTQPSGPCTNPNLLGPGLSYLPLTLTVNVAGDAPASVTNSATVSGGGDVNPANNTVNDPTTIIPGSDLTISKTHTGNFTRGQIGAKYTIRVTNTGTGTTSGLMTVTDAVPTGLTATSISSTSAGWTCTQPAGPCTNPNLLAPGASFLPLTLTVDVALDAPASVTNSATISGGGDINPANNTANDVTTINP